MSLELRSTDRVRKFESIEETDNIGFGLLIGFVDNKKKIDTIRLILLKHEKWK